MPTSIKNVLLLLFSFTTTNIYSQLCTGSLGDPVVDITFGSGPNPGRELSNITPGASTTYNFSPVSGNPALPTPYDGYYTVTNNVPYNMAWFSGQPDHTPGDINGFMAFFNSSENPGEFYKQTVQGLCENTKYEFSSWIANVLNPSVMTGVKPNLTFVIERIDGATLASYSTGSIDQKTSMTWEKYGFFFATPIGVNTVVLKIINNSPGGTVLPGNDLALDDINFRPCGPLLESSFSATTSQIVKDQYGFTPVTLYSTTSPGYTNPVYIWQLSTDNATTWTNLLSSNTLTYTYTPTSNGSFSFRLLAGEGGNINSSGCRVASGIITLNINQQPQGSVGGNTICSGGQGQLRFSPSNGLPPYSIVYTAGNNSVTLNNISSDSVIDVLPNPVVTSNYQLLSIKDRAGCVRTSGFTNSQATITVHNAPHITINESSSVCQGDSIQLYASGGALYRWNPARGLNNSTINNPKASPDSSTIYKVVVSNGTCKDSATTLIRVKPIPDIRLTPDSNLCEGQVIQLNATGGNKYVWYPSSTLNNSFTANPTAFPTTTTKYTVIVTNSAGCIDSAITTITIRPKPVISISPSRTLCKKDTVLLSSTGGRSYFWYPAVGIDNPYISNPKAFPDTSTTYTSVVTTAYGCNDSAKTTITVIPKPSLLIGSDTTVCAPVNLELDATLNGASSYLWNTGDITSKIKVINGGIYYVTVATNNCTVSDTIKVKEIKLPTVYLGPDTTICNFQTVQLTAKGTDIESYKWNTGSRNSSITTSTQGLYSLIASNRCGVDSDEIIISVIPCIDNIYFPSAFTPNGDNFNDRFKALYHSGLNIQYFRLSIFNRWGQLVFSTDDISKGWDGKIDGNQQPTGTFVWFAEYKKEQNGQMIQRKGTVTLIR